MSNIGSRSEIRGPIGHPRYREYAEDIHESGQHLLSLINDILDLSRIEAQRFELHEDGVIIAAVAEACIHLMSSQAERKKLRVNLSDLSSLGEIRADDRLMRHPGREYGYVLSGRLGVQLGFERHELETGDSIAFDSTMPHRLWNLGDEPVHGIWFVVGRDGLGSHTSGG